MSSDTPRTVTDESVCAAARKIVDALRPDDAFAVGIERNVAAIIDDLLREKYEQLADRLKAEYGYGPAGRYVSGPTLRRYADTGTSAIPALGMVQDTLHSMMRGRRMNEGVFLRLVEAGDRLIDDAAKERPDDC